MGRLLSLSHLTALSLAPPDLVSVAAEVGYGCVGVRLLPPAPGVPAYPLMDDAPQLRETLARLDGTGVRVFDIEIVRLDAGFAPGRHGAFLETGARLGARGILVAGDDRDPARLAQSFATFCEEAADFDMRVNIEFMPWTAVPDLTAARALLDQAGGPPNGAVLVDAIHFERSETTLDQVAALPPSRVQYMQLSDAPAGIPDHLDEILRQARYERLLPGEGGIDLRGLLKALPSEIPVAVEVWDAVRTPAMGAREWVRRAYDAARRVVDGTA